MTIGDKVQQYVAFKRHLGYKYATQEKVLLAYADHAMTHGDQLLTVERMVKWAGQAVSPKTAQCRFSTLHRFAVWLHAEDECHEVPPRDSLGRIKCRRPTPHLLTPSQIERIMVAALSLGPAGSIRPHTYHYLIGLLAATGMRRSEGPRPTVCGHHDGWACHPRDQVQEEQTRTHSRQRSGCSQ